MTKAQALNLMNTLEGQKIEASAVMTFDAAGTETWNVQLGIGTTYTGTQLAQLTTYCANNGLNLTIVVSQMGVI